MSTIQSYSGTLRHIKIKWVQFGLTIKAAMNEDVNPTFVNLLHETLPYRSLQNHALVSGNHLYHLVPSERLIYTRPDFVVSDRTKEPDGTVFLSSLQHLAIKYGHLTEYLPAVPCGQVVAEDMGNLRKAAQLIWDACIRTKVNIEVIVWDARHPEPDVSSLKLVRQRFGQTKRIEQLACEIANETEKCWSGTSADLLAIHSGLSVSRAGSKGSYFATMLFTNGEVRPLGYNALNGIIKIAVTEPGFDLSQLVTLYRTFVPVPADFLSYAGLEYLGSVHRRINALLDDLLLDDLASKNTGRADFLALVSSFGQYVNMLNAHNLHLFPWKHTSEYPIPTGQVNGST